MTSTEVLLKKKDGGWGRENKGLGKELRYIRENSRENLSEEQ